jgi:hypothetical protein
VKFIKFFFLIILFWNAFCPGFSATYFYQLYLHNEYYAQPPGFPSKVLVAPIVASFSGHRDNWKEDRFSGGIIEAVRFAHNHTWIEFLAAFGKEHVRFTHQGVFGRKSHFGGDDFLIDFGHNFLDETGKKQLLLHWLTGFPLTRRVTVDEVEQPLWGTRTFATGPVIEFVYGFIRSKEQDLFVGIIGRFLHRFKRHYEPILPSNALYHPGNTTDILVLIHNRCYGHNIEFGYVYALLNHTSYQFVDHTQPLPSDHTNAVYIDYSYYSEETSMGFEFNLTKTFGKPFKGIVFYGLVAWYF